ncbi:MAG: S-layer homology domain-containing protein [Chloroflexota bacterium]
MKKSKLTQIGVAVAALLLLFLGVAGMNASASYPVAQAAQSVSDKAVVQQLQSGQPLVRTAERSDVSRPMREIPVSITQSNQPEENENPLVNRSDPGMVVPRTFVDTVRQSALGPLAMPTPIMNFDGQYNQNGPIPPDPNGDVGRNQYVQSVNSTFQVFNKTTGASEYGPTNINNLFIGFGGLCETLNSGDPIVLYDPLAGRWLISQFTGQSNPTHQCIAISTSEDATGSYYRYDFITSPTTNAFEDYPHFGVWPDAYYMTTNEFGGPNSAGNYAFERQKMLVGDPTAHQVYFGTGGGGFLPADLDGNPPPTGSPGYFMAFNTLSSLGLWKFHVDWTTPANSTFTGPTNIPVAPFDTDICVAPREQCIDQPGTTARLEAIADRLMWRLAYRNMGSYESLVVNHTVDANGSGQAGIRWHEIRNPNAAPTLFQEGTYAPNDGTHRWMGSIAMDKQGNIALGFSASSSSVYPSLRYAGRLVGDPAGQLSQGEATLFAGTGSEDFPAAPRWGDYSALTVDPSDECTFWYTQEYFSQTALRAWRTRIGSFKFPGCTSGGTPTPVATATAPYSSPTVQATTTPCAGNVSYTESITNTDPTQSGRIGLGDPKSSCAAPKQVGTLSDQLTRHYKSHTYTNSSGSAQCVTVNISQACGNNAIQSIAYLGSFDPANILTNYLADGGAAGPNYSYSFTLPAGQTAVVVAVEVSPNLGCSTYTLSINPCQGATATATVTPGGPTATQTPAATATVCVQTYQVMTSTGASLIGATNDIGNHCDDCLTQVDLPFPVNVYGTTYNTAGVGSNGMLNFGSTNANIYTDNCLPVQSNPPPFVDTLFAYYDDLRTDVLTSTHGIYSATLGTTPNRQYVLRWHTTYYFSDTVSTNFEVVLTENSPVLSVIYGDNSTEAEGANPAAGIQHSLTDYTSYICNTDITSGTRVDYIPTGCGITPTPTAGLPTITATAGSPTATSTACTIEFEDVLPGNTFYPFIKCLACRNIINGYPCGGTGEPCNPNSDPYFRPSNFVTRGQLTKIVSQSAGFSDPVSGQTFEDVVPGSTFYTYTERLASRGVMGGYPCGIDPNEPCVLPGNKPYFRPSASATRGQLTKIVSNAAGFTDPDPATFTFTDVPPGSTFHVYVERLLLNRPGAMNGYPCGSPGEPCDSQSRPYFRPGATLSRGQTSKIVANTFFPNCQTPARK